MSWNEVSTMSLRLEFVMLALREGCNFALLCRSFNISRKTGYKWLHRFLKYGKPGLLDESRRPNSSPSKTDESIEATITTIRDQFPEWGGRKLKTILENRGHLNIPAPSTITTILRRNKKLDPEESKKHTPLTRFEHPYPNSLWQMDFKGNIPMRQGRCHPLTVLDDNSRFNLVLDACADEKTDTVKAALIASFRRYGLPDRITMDNGSPWGNQGFNDITPLTAWLIRLDIRVSHSRPYHPQTQGKDERFHRTLNIEVIRHNQFEDLAHCQRKFDEFRQVYNLERPHESLGLKPPISRYTPSERLYPEKLPDIDYGPDDLVRLVQLGEEISFRGKKFYVPKGLHGYPVALRPTEDDGTYAVYFCRYQVKEIDFNETQN